MRKHTRPSEEAVDLTRHFRWRWQEHGIYLGVCAVFGLVAAMVALLPPPSDRDKLDLSDTILSRYVDDLRLTPLYALHTLSGPVTSGKTAQQPVGPLGGPDLGRSASAPSMFARRTARGSEAEHALGGLAGVRIGTLGRMGKMGTGGGGTGEGSIGFGNFGSVRADSGAGKGYGRTLGGAALRSVQAARHAGAFGLSAPMPMPEPSVPGPAPAIDPNGRFATTYRPGGGHLAWFDAELSHNRIPAELRQLVGDLGSRYSQPLPPPTQKALVQQVDVERSALAPSGGPLNLRITLRSSDRRPDPEHARPPLSVHVVLDISGSMAGEPLANALSAVQRLVARLNGSDRFSLTTFESTAQVQISDGTVGPRRQSILDQLSRIRTAGGTNLSQGLALGYGEARRASLGPEWVSLVMLLSDGQANQGIVSPAYLTAHAAEAFQSGVQTSTFGVGDQHDGQLLSQLSERGAGGYYYLASSEAISKALTTELESRLQPVAQAVEVRVRLRPDVQLVATHGSRKLGAEESAQVRSQEQAVDTHAAQRDHIDRDRVREVEGGMRFFIPGFSRDDQHVILLGLQVPPGVHEREIAKVELHYKDRLSRSNVADEQVVRVRYADSEVASAATINRSVAATVQGFAAGETLIEAASMLGSINQGAARGLLAERAALMRRSAQVLHAPRLALDAGRLERMGELTVGGQGRDPLLLAQVLSTSGWGLLR
jgi:Ca-activated chloride channel family protein